MDLWKKWMFIVWGLRSACATQATFWWMVVILASFTVRPDLAGVTSFIRGHWLLGHCYKRILDQFGGTGIKIDLLTQLWVKICLKVFARFLFNVEGRVVLLADGIKNPKEGRKMPGVKFCHQESNNNSKPEYIMAHSIQAVSLLVGSMGVFFGVPLVARIHEGVVLSNRDQRTLYDKLNAMIMSLSLPVQYYLLADAYYSVRKVVKGALANGSHLISRVRNNAVAYMPAESPKKRKRGRPRIYGDKIVLKDLFSNLPMFTEIDSPFASDVGVKIRYHVLDLIWKPVGRAVRFVLVDHPKGRWILIGTDLTLDPVRMIELYGLRFRIELCFKQLVYVVGAFAYRFWLKAMKRRKRGDGNQYLHHETREFRENFLAKIGAYNLHMQLGIIALGLMQWLSLEFPKRVWRHFGSWMRTMNTRMPPSELVVANAMRNTLVDFLVGMPQGDAFAKFLENKIDFDRLMRLRYAG